MEKKGKDKEAVEKLRRLLNTNFKDNTIKLELGYKSKTEESLLTVKR